ncbi:MAG TPA: GNAT family protein [Solirubrobacteraceae bacterium]|nr:GNAT family protein [Solirubrobacteraceae bacterium]
MPGAVQLLPYGPEHVERIASLWFKNRDDLLRVNPSRHDGSLTLEQALDDAARAAERNDRQERCYLVILSDGDVVGDVGISGITRGPMQSANLGVFVDRDVRGRGIGARAIALACEVAFGELELHRVEAGVQPSNLASLAIFRRNGFTEIGLAPGFLFVDGAWRDHILLQKLAP